MGLNVTDINFSLHAHCVLIMHITCRSSCCVVAVRWLRGVTGHVNTSVVSGAAAATRQTTAGCEHDGADSRARCLPVVWRCRRRPRRELGARPRPDLASTRIYWCVTTRHDACRLTGWRLDSTYVPSYVRVCSAEPIQVAVHQFVPHRIILLKHSWLFELRYLVSVDIITALTMGDAICEII